MSGETLVIGIGNELRGDDGVGPRVARRVRVRAPELSVIELEREPSALIERWDGAQRALVIDAVAGPQPGRLHRLAPIAGSRIEISSPASSHSVGLGEVIELARSLGRLPRELIVFGIEGASFGLGLELSAPVAGRVDEVADEVLAATLAPVAT